MGYPRTRMDTQRDIMQCIGDELLDSGLEGSQVSFWTTLFGHSIYEAFSRIVQKLILELPPLKTLLDLLIRYDKLKKFSFLTWLVNYMKPPTRFLSGAFLMPVFHYDQGSFKQASRFPFTTHPPGNATNLKKSLCLRLKSSGALWRKSRMSHSPILCFSRNNRMQPYIRHLIFI